MPGGCFGFLPSTATEDPLPSKSLPNLYLGSMKATASWRPSSPSTLTMPWTFLASSGAMTIPQFRLWVDGLCLQNSGNTLVKHGKTMQNLLKLTMSGKSWGVPQVWDIPMSANTWGWSSPWRSIGPCIKNRRADLAFLLPLYIEVWNFKRPWQNHIKGCQLNPNKWWIDTL